MREKSRTEQIGSSLEDTTREVFFPTAPTWQHQGACLGTHPGLFFPERWQSTKPAKKICKNCEVKEECLQFALDIGERFGIWGGMSEKERRKFRAKLARQDRKNNSNIH